MYCVFSFLTGQGAIIVNKSDFFRIRDGLEYMMSIPCLCKSRGGVCRFVCLWESPDCSRTDAWLVGEVSSSYSA